MGLRSQVGENDAFGKAQKKIDEKMMEERLKTRSKREANKHRRRLTTRYLGNRVWHTPYGEGGGKAATGREKLEKRLIAMKQ